MRRSESKLLVAFALLLLPTAHADPGPGVYDLEIAPLVPGIYLIHRPDPFRQPVEPNATVIVNDEDVVVVDAGGSFLSAENAIALIRGITPKPVSVLVNTHWHGDHNLGNQAYRSAFPGIRIVGHTNTRKHMLGEPMRYVERYPAQIGAAVDDLRSQQAKGELDAHGVQTLADYELMKREFERARIAPPDVTLDESMVLHRGAREIQIRHLGRANTDGDLIVWLPAEKILVSGDLVVHPIPYGFGSFPGDWVSALEELRNYPYQLLVPGHGDVQRDGEYLENLRKLLIDIRAQVAEAVSKGLDLAATRKAVDRSRFPSEFAQSDALRKSLFEAWWVNPIVRSAWLEARGEPIKQGASDETG